MFNILFIIFFYKNKKIKQNHSNHKYTNLNNYSLTSNETII